MSLQETVKKIEQNLNMLGGLRNIKVHFSDTDNYIRYKLADEKYQDKYQVMCSWLKRVISINHPYVIIDCYPPENCKIKDKNLEKKIIIKIDDSIKNYDARQQVLEKAALEFNGILKRWVKYGAQRRDFRRGL